MAGRRRTTATAGPSTANVIQFDPQAFTKLDPSEYLVVLPGRPTQIVSCRVDIETMAMLDILVADKRLPFESSRSRFLLWCMIRGIEHLAEKLDSREVQDSLAIMGLSLAKARVEMMSERIETFLAENLAALRHYIRKGDYPAAESLIDRVEEVVHKSKNPQIQETGRKRIKGMRVLLTLAKKKAGQAEAEVEADEQGADVLKALGITPDYDEPTGGGVDV